MKPRAMRKRAVLMELGELGMSQKKVAAVLNLPHPSISCYCRTLGVKLPRERGGYAPVVAKSRERAEAMAALYRGGYTLEQIGSQYGLTRERVRQLMAKHFGITGADGGHHTQIAVKKARVRAYRNDRYMKSHGCTWAQFVEVRAIGKAMKEAGARHGRTPFGAYQSQRRNAGARGVGWELTFWQWWTIWLESGHWEQRGRGQGYVMCRRGDVGPYAVGNVFIGTAAQNSYEGQVKRYKLAGDLPMGVRRTAGGRYVAHRRNRHLGTYDTPEAAHAAYLLDAPTKARIVTRHKYNLPPGVRHSGARFGAYFYQGKKQVHLGTFKTIDEAVAARAAALAPLARAA